MGKGWEISRGLRHLKETGGMFFHLVIPFKASSLLNAMAKIISRILRSCEDVSNDKRICKSQKLLLFRVSVYLFIGARLDNSD